MPHNFIIHTPEEIERIRIAGRLTAQVRDAIRELEKAAKPEKKTSPETEA